MKKILCWFLGHSETYVLSRDPWDGQIWIRACKRCLIRLPDIPDEEVSNG